MPLHTHTHFSSTCVCPLRCDCHINAPPRSQKSRFFARVQPHWHGGTVDFPSWPPSDSQLRCHHESCSQRDTRQMNATVRRLSGINIRRSQVIHTRLQRCAYTEKAAANYYFHYELFFFCLLTIHSFSPFKFWKKPATVCQSSAWRRRHFTSQNSKIFNSKWHKTEKIKRNPDIREEAVNKRSQSPVLTWTH